MSIVVVIPARNEAETIGRTLAALAAQDHDQSFEVLVVANNCTDDTAAQARAAAVTYPTLRLNVMEVTLPPDQAHVVGARRLAFEAGMQLAGSGGILVSTDADSEAVPGWLSALVAPLRQGWEASAGRIQLRRAERLALPSPVRTVYLLDTGYRQIAAQLHRRIISPTATRPTHWQHFGANLALTVRAYQAVGGLPDVPCLEDIALVAALERADLPLYHTHTARVYTSARLSGRVPVGLSTQLEEWHSGPERWFVPGGYELVAAAQAEQLLKQCWQERRCIPEQVDALRQAWRLTKACAVDISALPTLGSALEALRLARDQAGDWSAEFPPIPVRQALLEVRTILAGYGGGGFQTR